MAPQKLTEADKQEILTLYRTSDETTSSLAGRFSVSTSTISRILKQSLSEDEYDALIQSKRVRGSSSTSTDDEQEPADQQLSVLGEEEVSPAPEPVAPPKPIRKPPVSSTPLPAVATENGSVPAEESTSSRSRRRRPSAASRSAADNPVLIELEELEKEIQQELRHSVYENIDELSADHKDPIVQVAETRVEEDLAPRDLPEVLDEDLDDEDLDDEDLDDEDLDDLDDELQDDEDEDLGEEGEADYSAIHLQGDREVEILPLAQAALPRTCYLVVDRAAELITRPLSDFADLGQIPEIEAQARTLPVFDNHRVAKRFMRRMQRIVKIPDTQMFFKASPYLQAKGITRLLVDGQIYALDMVEVE